MIHKKVFWGVEKSRQTDILPQHLKIPFSEIYAFSQMLQCSHFCEKCDVVNYTVNSSQWMMMDRRPEQCCFIPPPQ